MFVYVYPICVANTNNIKVSKRINRFLGDFHSGREHLYTTRAIYNMLRFIQKLDSDRVANKWIAVQKLNSRCHEDTQKKKKTPIVYVTYIQFILYWWYCQQFSIESITIRICLLFLSPESKETTRYDGYTGVTHYYIQYTHILIYHYIIALLRSFNIRYYTHDV